jgi:hypothetical protein
MEAHVRAVFDDHRNFEDGSIEPDRPERKRFRDTLRAYIAWVFRLVGLVGR